MAANLAWGLQRSRPRAIGRIEVLGSSSEIEESEPSEQDRVDLSHKDE